MKQFRKTDDDRYVTGVEITYELSTEEVVTVLASGADDDASWEGDREAMGRVLYTALRAHGEAILDEEVGAMRWLATAQRVLPLLPADRAMDLATAVMRRIQEAGGPDSIESTA